MISMAHALGLSVVAEGVDQMAQAEFLHAQNCDELQGFLISGAVDPCEFLRFRSEYENILPALK